MSQNTNRLPAFKTYQESSFEDFKKSHKMFILWACLQWGALILQSSFTVFIASQSENLYVSTEITIFVLYLVAWILFIILLKMSSRSSKWHWWFEISPIFGVLLISATNLWRARSGISDQTLDEKTDFLQRFAEISFNISCFLFLARRERVRTVCFVIYVLYNIINAAILDEIIDWIDMVRASLFYAVSSAAFGILSFALYQGHKTQLEEQKEFWRLSFEMIPHGIAIFDGNLKLVYNNQSLESVLSEFEGIDSLQSSHSRFSKKILQLPILLRATMPSQQNMEGAINKLATANANKSTISRLEFGEFLTQHVSQSDHYVPIFADSTVGRKSIEIKAQKATFKEHGDFFITVFVDVTDRDKIVQLEDQVGFKDLLFKSVSHELRGPLNGSMVSISSLLTQDLPQDCKEVLNTSLVCQRRLLKSIDGILDLVKINSKQFTPVLQQFDLKELIQDALAFFDDIIQKKKISTHFEIFEDHPSSVTIYSDPDRVDQMLYQVLDNAIKFTPPNGRLFFSAKILPLSPTPDVEEEDKFEITVGDSGCGLTPEEIAKIYALPSTGFTKSKVSENSTGACLGLSIVTHLLKKLGSGFNIQSEVSRGSSFSFRLRNFKMVQPSILLEQTNFGQLAESATVFQAHNRLSEIDSASFQPEVERWKTINYTERLSTRSPSASKCLFMKKREETEELSPLPRKYFLSKARDSTTGRQAKKLLVVDDDAFNVFALKRTLNQKDYEVLTAYNGEEALETLKVHHASVGIVFMDLNMPVMDGYAATKELKRLMKVKEISTVPIIACTAYAQESERQICFEIGFDDFLTKPINPKKLDEALRKFGNEHRVV